MYAICKLVKDYLSYPWSLEIVYRDTISQDLDLVYNSYVSNNMPYKPNYPHNGNLYTSFARVSSNAVSDNRKDHKGSYFRYAIVNITDVWDIFNASVNIYVIESKEVVNGEVVFRAFKAKY